MKRFTIRANGWFFETTTFTLRQALEMLDVMEKPFSEVLCVEVHSL